MKVPVEELEDSDVMLKRVSATNNPPSTSETAQIRNLLSQAVARLASIDEERPKILSTSLTCRTALSPLRTLPTELLREIFLLFVLHSCRPSTLRASILLSSVCHRWRSVALSIPQLWANISFSPSSQNSSECCIELMKLCGYRSQHYPLSITLDRHHHRKDIATVTMLRAAIRHVGRWKHFELNNHSSQDIQCSFPECHAPLLESLKVETSNLPLSSRLLLWIRSLVRKAPRLRILHIDGFRDHFDDAPWGQLTDIQIKVRDGLSIRTCHSILSQAHHIERCMFNIYLESATPSISSLITLHHLRECSIDTTIPLAELFNHISCPALRNLSIDQYAEDTTLWSKESFSSFMARSSCSLLSFYTTQPKMAEGDAMQCLRDMPSTLVSLDLSTFDITDRVLNLLTVGSFESNGIRCICPRLESITMGLAINTTEGVFTDMVESRMRDSTELTNMQISRLRHVEVVFDENEEDVKRLLEWGKRGLTVYVDVVSDRDQDQTGSISTEESV